MRQESVDLHSDGELYYLNFQLQYMDVEFMALNFTLKIQWWVRAEVKYDYSGSNWAKQDVQAIY